MGITAGALNRAAIKHWLLITAFFAAVETCPAPSFAAEPDMRPEQIVLELTKQLKLTGDERAVLEVVDWQEAYERTPLSSREGLNIKSADDLKAFYMESITKSPLLGLRRAGSALEKLPPDKRKTLEKQMQRLGAASNYTPSSDRFVNTLFEHKKTIVDPEYATVQLYMTEQGNTKEIFVQLIKRGDTWMFPCVQIIEDPLKVCR